MLITIAHGLTSAGLALGGLAASSSSSNGDGSIYLLLLGPIAGFLFYTAVYMRYRNTDKDNEYEVLTDSQIDEVTGFDRKVRSRDGLQNPRIEGDNSRSPRQRLGSGTKIYRLE